MLIRIRLFYVNPFLSSFAKTVDFKDKFFNSLKILSIIKVTCIKNFKKILLKLLVPDYCSLKVFFHTQPAITWSNLTIETLEQSMNSVQS